MSTERLCNACIAGRLSLVRALLAADANIVDVQNSTGDVALRLAARYSQTKVVQELLVAGTNVN